MKKSLIVLFCICTLKLSAQPNWIKQPVDSMVVLIEKLEKIADTKLILLERTDNAENYYWRDTSGYIKVKASIANDKKFEGTKVVVSPNYVRSITISGPQAIIDRLFSEYIKTTTDKPVRAGFKFFHTLKWDAINDEEQITDKNYYNKMPGKSLFISEHSNF